MKRLNKKRLNYSAWLTLFITYVLPYRYTDNFETSYGYPIPFITIHDVPLEKTPLQSMGVNLLAVVLNVLIVYFIFTIIVIIIEKIKAKRKEKFRDSY